MQWALLPMTAAMAVIAGKFVLQIIAVAAGPEPSSSASSIVAAADQVKWTAVASARGQAVRELCKPESL